MHLGALISKDLAFRAGALPRRQCPFTEGWEVTRKRAPFWSKTWDTHSYWWSATAAYLRSTWRCSKHSAAIYYLGLGQQVMKWCYSLSLRNKTRKSKGKADVTPKGTRTVAAQELLPALPNRNTSQEHLTHQATASLEANSDSFPHVQLLFSPSKRVLGKWTARTHLSKHFLPRTVCLVACTAPFPRGWAQGLPGAHSPEGDLIRKASERVIAVSRLSLSERHPERGLAAQQDGAQRCSRWLLCSTRGISASQVSFTCSRLLRLRRQRSVGLSSLMWRQQHKQESRQVYFSVFHRSDASHDHVRGMSLLSSLWAK